MTESATVSLSRLIVAIGAFVLIGFPLVGYLWEALNHLLAGEVRPTQLLISVPLALVFLGVLVMLARTVRAWEGERREHQARPPAS
ncbi:MAG TPA: hypothetical protein VFZ26_17235 [Gemmatimonadales bacterium]